MENIIDCLTNLNFVRSQNSNKENNALNKLRSVFIEQIEKESKNIIDVMVESVQNSKELTSVENDEYFHQWSRADLFSLFDTKNNDLCNIFQDYMLENHCIYVDFKNDCLTYSIGPAILVLSDGNVYDQDSGKTIIQAEEYENTFDLDDTVKRNELIESWMEKNGYFPSVLKVDRYGNAFFINTKKEG